MKRFIQLSGVASRRKADLLIKQRRVKVNGITVDDFNYEVDVERDRIEVDGEPVELRYSKVYYILNKPRGYLTTLSDPFGRKTISDLIKNKIEERVFPVGRLDKDSEGLLILTNDGELANRIMHPRYGVLRKYLVRISGVLSKDEIFRLREGVKLDGNHIGSFDFIDVLKVKRGVTTVLVGLREGKKRQIRKMFSALGKKVLRLIRISIGPLKLGHLKPGEIRRISEDELKKLKMYLRIEEEGKNEGGPRRSSSTDL